MGPLIGAGALVASALLSRKGVQDQNRAQRREAALNRQFQERMSSTAWRRSVEDMRLAGINPMLAYQQGGASTPGGAVARQEDELGPAISTAMHGLRLKQELRIMKEQEHNLAATRDNIARDTDLKRMQQREREELARESWLRQTLLQLQIPAARAAADFYSTKPGKASVWIERLRQAVFGGQLPFYLLPGLRGRNTTVTHVRGGTK